MSWHETCTCKFKLDESVFSGKRRRNSDKFRCECKELIEKGRCDDWFTWNSSVCECDKSYDIGEYLDYLNCKCRKRLTDKLVEKYDKDTDEN